MTNFFYHMGSALMMLAILWSTWLMVHDAWRAIRHGGRHILSTVASIIIMLCLVGLWHDWFGWMV